MRLAFLPLVTVLFAGVAFAQAEAPAPAPEQQPAPAAEAPGAPAPAMPEAAPAPAQPVLPEEMQHTGQPHEIEQAAPATSPNAPPLGHGPHVAEENRGEHGVDHAPLSCEQILSEHEEHGEEGGHDLASTIFEHVTDANEIEFQNPLNGEAAHFNFKRGLCRATGWNGVAYYNPTSHFTVDLTPTKHLFWMWIAALLLILAFVVSAPKKGQVVATGMGGMLEAMVLFVRDELSRKNIPDQKEADRYTPYLLTCFFFILTMNLLGLIPYTGTATGNIAVTAALALLTFLLTQAAGIRAAGLGGYLGHLTGGVHWALWPIMIPVEFLGLFTKPFALAIRLFANMVAGHIVIYFLLGLIFLLKTLALAPVSVAFALGIYLLELFVALVQAYVFTMLSALFIGFGVAMGHHGHHDDKSGAHGETHGDHAVHH